MYKMCCIIGLTGAGKSTYLDYILKYKKEHGLADMNRLVYYTTRKPRLGERDGVDYYFSESKPPSLITIQNLDNGMSEFTQNPVLIEERVYDTMNNGTVYYYTTVDCVKEDYYICAPSIEQLNSYLDYFGPDKIIVVDIDTNIKTRMNRILDKRAKTDNDVYELCRRILQEKEDWKNANSASLIKRLHHYLLVDNNVEANFQKNADEIFEFIREEFHKA